MRQLLLLLFLCCSPLLRSQEKPQLTIENVENEIKEYISKQKNTFKLPPEQIVKIKENITRENKKHNTVFNKRNFEATLDKIKNHELRKQFFEKNPRKKSLYESPLKSEFAKQTCSTGGFETGNIDAIYTLKHAINPPYPSDPTQIQTNTTNFVPEAISSTLNDFGAFGTLVSPGQDPMIPALNRVLSGNRAIKLNFAEIPQSTSDVVSLSRSLLINENSLDINYSLILNDPELSHSTNEKPFFLIRLYDSSNNIIRSVNVLTNKQDCSLNSVPSTPGYDDESFFLYTDWNCARINTSDLIGQNVRLEFVIGDCAFNGHFGTVYIDDLCNTSCSNPLFGSINLNSIETITCPSQTQTICGTYQIPANSIYGGISLDIMHGNTLITTIPNPSSLTSSTFCFNVQPSDFGANPNGNYEFVVRGQFIRECVINYQLDPIFDYSTNDSGPDVFFKDCIHAVVDDASFSTCTTSTIMILENDTVFGIPATTGNVSITQIGPVIPQLTLNTALGLVSVTPGTPPGVYNILYRICKINNPTHCDEAGITVTITSPVLNAVNDDFTTNPINSCLGGATSTVFNNDSFCNAFLNPSLYSVTLVNNGGASGATINSSGNITIPANIVPGDYTLTYQVCEIANPSNCDTATVLIKVNPGETPVFNFPTTFCNGSVAPALPPISNNQIPGTWSSSQISTSIIGNYNYTFTPTGVCSMPVTIPISIIPCGIFISWGSDVSCQITESDPRPIKFDENIADGPCIRVCENSTITYSLTGSTGTIDHTTWNITGGNVISSSNTSITINWTTASFCALKGIIYLTDGTTKEIHKCIEKLEAPNTSFGVLPDVENPEIYGCVDSPINFENLTTSDGGNEVIYYNWDFGDGTFSSEFEPSHIYNTPGTYRVTLWAYNGCSCIGKYRADVIIETGGIPISCASVACEGMISHYSIPKEYVNCSIDWEVNGGEIVSTYESNTIAEVNWTNIDQEGFGYLTVKTGCSHCSTTIKVPVVQLHGTIKGENTMCINSQHIFSLPKWPTTEFNWTLNDGGTGATLLYNNQRNEVVLQSGTSGTIELLCHYYNTLLGCGGTAKMTIAVKPSLYLSGPTTVCPNSSIAYEIQNENGNNINTVNWTITGPSGFSQTGSGSPFTFTYPVPGVYNFSIMSPNYCTTEVFNINVLNITTAPTSILGPLTICPGVPINYSCVPPTGAVTHWQVTNGTIIGSSIGNQIIVNFDTQPTGAFEVKAWYEYEGCNSTIYTITPTIETPDLTLTENNALVCGSSYASYAVSSSIIADNFTWSIEPASAGSVQYGQNTNQVSILWNQNPGVAQVKLQVRKCSQFFTQYYPVTVITSPAITISTPTTTICNGIPASFSFVMTPGTAFTNVTWDFGDGTNPVTTNNTSIQHSFVTSNSSIVNLTITATVNGANGCILPAIGTLQVSVSPTPEVSVSPAVNLNLCDPDNTAADYTYSVVMQGGIISTDIVQWYSGIFPNGTLVSGGNTPTIDLHALGAGTYYALVTNSYGCIKNTRSIRVVSNCPTGTYNCTTANNLDATITSIGCQSIKATATLVEGTPFEVFWSDYQDIPGTVTSISPNLQIENIEPGEYTISLNATYHVGSNICYNNRHFTFIVPYKADLRYDVSCTTTTNNYTVTLYDFSTYYPETPATSFEFSVDNGGSWQTGTLVSGIAQITTSLASGTYNVGIRISRSGYPSCVKFIPLELPALPSAAFHFDNNACMGTAMQFYAHDTTDGLQYHWNFGDGAINLQRNPKRTFETFGNNPVTLTVTNKYGCSTSLTQQVNVLDVQLRGVITSNPVNVCQGSTIELEYVPGFLQEMPVQFNWYYNEYTPVPFATTTTPNLTVSQNGQYFVYVTDANGCSVYTNDPVTAVFVPAPEPPKVKGPQIVCSGNPFSLTVPQMASVRYIWTLNGVAQPQWNNMSTINTMQTTLSTYVYAVTAQVQDSSGNYCSSNPVTHTVAVMDPPNVPQLDFELVSCNPYKYKVTVLNPQAGVRYYWSNGNTGTIAYSTHDGPIQVRAEVNDCSVTAQTDLPINLESVAWVFPKGCYEICKEKPDGYIIGPFGYYNEWQWQMDSSSYAGGTGIVSPFTDLSTGHEYQLYLHNGDCNYTAATMSISQNKDCKSCDLSYTVDRIRCIKINEMYVYSINLTITNPYSDAVWSTLTAPDAEGYFINNTIFIPGGNTLSTTLYFYPTNGFNGGTVTLDMNGSFAENGKCYTETSMDFPYCTSMSSKENEDETEQKTNELLLLAAPNPAIASTTLLYLYTNNSSTKTIELRDMQGRFLNVWEIKKPNGTIEMDCSGYAGGQYLILMKENNAVIKQCRLLINH